MAHLLAQLGHEDVRTEVDEGLRIFDYKRSLATRDHRLVFLFDKTRDKFVSRGILDPQK